MCSSDLLALGPSQVHASEHLRPVGGVHAACTGINAQNGAVRVELAVEIRRHFGAIDFFLRGRYSGVDLVRSGRIIRKEGKQFASIVERAGNVVEKVHVRSQIGKLFHDSLRRIGVVPKTFRARAAVEVGD